MVQLQQNLKELQAVGGQLVGISYDSVEILRRFTDRNGIAFPLLSDPGSKTIDAYGIRNQEVPPRRSGIPYPGTFIVDQKGVIRAKLFLADYRQRHPAADIIKGLREVSEHPAPPQ